MKNQTQVRGKPTGEASRTTRDDVAECVANDGFCFFPFGSRLFPKVEKTHDWFAFADSWNRLTADPYLPTGAGTRLRRFAALRYNPRSLSLSQTGQLHFFQSEDINSIAGGIHRRFSAVEETTLRGRLLRQLVLESHRALPLTALEWESDFQINVHQIRVRATSDTPGQPTPEGIHSDGHQYVLQLLININNTRGPLSQVYSRDRELIAECTLCEPLDALLLDDQRLRHAVTPLVPADPSKSAVRDMLLLDFNLETSK